MSLQVDAQNRIIAVQAEIQDLEYKKEELRHEYDLAQVAVNDEQQRHAELNSEMKNMNAQLRGIDEDINKSRSNKKCVAILFFLKKYPKF